jgi:hypothetical protein
LTKHEELKMKISVLTVAVMTALASHAALADPEADFWHRPNVYGTPATATSADRTIYVGPNSHRLNVAYGETVRFVAESGNVPERSFTWRFDVVPEGTSVDLSKVAPADFPSHNVQVFVSPDPLYVGG